MPLLPTDRAFFQQRALSGYLSLTAPQPSWTGRLVLLEASPEAAPLALAVLAAGGAVLLYAQDAPTLRDANGSGLTDFNVTSLAEAVRALKNELRKGQPIGVGLLDASGTALHEMVARGLQPNAMFPAVCAGPAGQPAWQVLRGRGAILLDAPSLSLADGLQTDTADGWRQRRAGDRTLLEAASRLPPSHRGIAVQWLHAAARLFPHDLDRCYVAAWRASEEP